MNGKFRSVHKVCKMADVNWSDDDEVERFFNENDDANSDFEGFGEEDILLRNGNIVVDLQMDDFVPVNDRDFPIDMENGWQAVDSPPFIAPFTGNAGLNVEMDKTDPINFFELFIDDDFIKMLVEQTNLYAQKRYEGGNFSTHSRGKQWRPFTLSEMKVFLAMIISMGLCYKNDVQDYWNCDETQDTPFFRQNMSRDRFLIILSNFHQREFLPAYYLQLANTIYPN